MIEGAFWMSAAWLLYVFVGYAFWVWLRAAVIDRERGPSDSVEIDPPKISMIIAVHNGEELIQDKIADCLRQDWPMSALEVLIASDGSTDATEERVRQIEDPRIRWVPGTARRGKEAAQKRAIAVATGEILIFSDAGVSLAPGALRQLIACFDDPQVGCVSGIDRVLDAEGRSEGEGAFVRYDTWLKQQESRGGSTVGNSGWLFAVRRKFCRVWPEGLDSDFGVLLRVVRAGSRGILAPEAIAAGCAVPSERDELQRKVRTMVRGMAVLAAHRDLLNPFRHGFFAGQLVSHKLLRWLLPVPMLGLWISAGLLMPTSRLFACAFVAQSVFWSLGFCMPQMKLPLVKLARYFTVATVAAVLAGWEFLRGERYVHWQPTSRRLTRVNER